MHKFYEAVTFNVNVIIYAIETIHIDSENLTFYLTFAES